MGRPWVTGVRKATLGGAERPTGWRELRWIPLSGMSTGRMGMEDALAGYGGQKSPVERGCWGKKMGDAPPHPEPREGTQVGNGRG